MDLQPVIAAERRRIADLLETLSPAQLTTPSLCTQWTVQQVAGHLLAGAAGPASALLAATVRAGFRLHAGNARLAAQVAARPAAAMAADLRRYADRPARPVLGQYADLHIHGQDMRRPLGLPHGFPLDHLRVVLDFLTGGRAWGFAPRRRVAGLRFESTDLDWSAGAGPVLAGPAEALMMALTGRGVALGELDGPGVRVLRDRLGG
ncbi:maleylpyruvate isomerase family mycothiol-dependent enzyme [Actinoplanes sp. NBRC 103695]|uniref:maleylpyruvate isomerase family mycothiol-dependent enzyme n=1 Tax=Actinoplanes sp. NBRC 103695 TaxID=3032202 RepID=UPI0024A5DA04|nr:maleylpyruvate isomerase family mycothiol-dependent enzyme [Actinoplanes sp. NBRC 103695]GLY97675.1 hypothetical protein Acsp02_49290 [Actinoplanes sp. NBRC 103695]